MPKYVIERNLPGDHHRSDHGRASLTEHEMTAAKWWLRIVGALYLLMFAMAAVLRLPIRALGPAGVLDHAAAGDPTAKLLVDTWFTLGLEFVAVGTALLVLSRAPEKARSLVVTVLGIELVRGIGTDIYMLWRGYETMPQMIWILVHAVVIATGVLALRS